MSSRQFFFRWTGYANIHFTVTLPAVGTQYLCAKMLSHTDGQGCFTHGRWPGNNNSGMCSIGNRNNVKVKYKLIKIEEKA